MIFFAFFCMSCPELHQWCTGCSSYCEGLTMIITIVNREQWATALVTLRLMRDGQRISQSHHILTSHTLNPFGWRWWSLRFQNPFRFRKFWPQTENVTGGEIFHHSVEDKRASWPLSAPRKSPRPLKEFDRCRPANGKNTSFGIGWAPTAIFWLPGFHFCLHQQVPKWDLCDTLNLHWHMMF